MANFHETIKATKSGEIQISSYSSIVICKTVADFRRRVCNTHMNSYFMFTNSKNFDASCRASHPVEEMETVFDYPYMEDNYQSLHIQYKDTHRNAKIAGRRYFWTNDDEDLNGTEEGKSSWDNKGFGIPRFDGVASAVYMDDYEIIIYNGTVEADLEDEFTVRLHVFMGGEEVSETMISAEEFGDYFPLEENFYNYDEIFWESEDEPIHPYCDCWYEPSEEEVEADTQKLLARTAECKKESNEAAQDETEASQTATEAAQKEAAQTEAAQIVAETALESKNENDANERTTDDKDANTEQSATIETIEQERALPYAYTEADRRDESPEDNFRLKTKAPEIVDYNLTLQKDLTNLIIERAEFVSNTMRKLQVSQLHIRNGDPLAVIASKTRSIAAKRFGTVLVSCAIARLTIVGLKYYSRERNDERNWAKQYLVEDPEICSRMSCFQYSYMNALCLAREEMKPQIERRNKALALIGKRYFSTSCI